jgi:DNA helicase-2/ATP-dependent DNA helicase PcrA
VISKNGTHPILDLHSTRNQGSSITIQDLDNDQYEALYIATEIEKTAQSIPYNSIAVLYRMNAQSRSIEEALLHYGIPYVLIGGTRFYQRKEIKDILSYLRLLVNHDDELSESRVKKIGKKRHEQFLQYRAELSKDVEITPTIDIMEGVLSKTGYSTKFSDKDPEDLVRLENIKELKGVAISYPNITRFLEQVALVESEYSENEKKNKDKKGVFLMTLHQAKGLEFPYVFISGVEDGILPHLRSIYDNESLEEERRLFYVGITRAKDKLYITYAKRRFFFGRSGYSVKSRFLEEAEGKMVE